jgi:hypothetical protein
MAYYFEKDNVVYRVDSEEELYPENPRDYSDHTIMHVWSGRDIYGDPDSTFFSAEGKTATLFNMITEAHFEEDELRKMLMNGDFTGWKLTEDQGALHLTDGSYHDIFQLDADMLDIVESLQDAKAYANILTKFRNYYFLPLNVYEHGVVVIDEASDMQTADGFICVQKENPNSTLEQFQEYAYSLCRAEVDDYNQFLNETQYIVTVEELTLDGDWKQADCVRLYPEKYYDSPEKEYLYCEYGNRMPTLYKEVSEVPAYKKYEVPIRITELSKQCSTLLGLTKDPALKSALQNVLEVIH